MFLMESPRMTCCYFDTHSSHSKAHMLNAQQSFLEMLSVRAYLRDVQVISS